MIPSYVTRRPTGKETGSYLALDLGGNYSIHINYQSKKDIYIGMEN